MSLELDPQLEDEEIFDTISLIALAGMTVVLHLRHSLEITVNEVEFSALGRRYIELYREGVAEFRERHKDRDPGTCSEDFPIRKR